MRRGDGAEFGYRIKPMAGGWRWVAFDPQGGILESGAARDRAIAAACVIRAIARAPHSRSAAA